MTRWNYFGIAGAILIADQATKAAVVARFTNGADDAMVGIIPGMFRLVHVENRGIAFGLFSDSASPWAAMVLTLISMAAIALVGALLWQNQAAPKLTRTGLALILGGAAGNLLDRLLRGQVVDFLDFYFSSYHWPAFNIADSAICIGAALLLLDLLWDRHAKLDAGPISTENR